MGDFGGGKGGSLLRVLFCSLFKLAIYSTIYLSASAFFSLFFLLSLLIIYHLASFVFALAIYCISCALRE